MTSLVLTNGPVGRRQALPAPEGRFSSFLFVSFLTPPNMKTWFHFDSERHFLSEVQFDRTFMQISPNAFKRLKLKKRSLEGNTDWIIISEVKLQGH